MRRFSSSKITIKDIAAASDVSFQAVSLALRGRPGVSERKRMEIKQLAQRLGYYPNAAAQRLPSKKEKQLGLIVADRHGFRGASGLLDTFVDSCQRMNRRYHLELHHHLDDRGAFEPPHILAGGLVDGVILVGDVGQPLRDWLEKRSLPWVSIYEPARYCVLTAGDRGIRRALEHLAALGHRRIAAWFGPLQYEAHRLRRQAFETGVREMNLEMPDRHFIGIAEALSGIEALRETMAWSHDLLGRADRPTAVIGAARAMTQVALERGMRIPRDLSLVEWLSPYDAQSSYHPVMAALHTDLPTIMREAMDLLESQLKGETPQRPRRWVEPELFAGGSTGPAERSGTTEKNFLV